MKKKKLKNHSGWTLPKEPTKKPRTNPQFTLGAAGTRQKSQHNPENCPLPKKISKGLNCGISLFLAQERNSEAADDLKWVLKRRKEGN